MWRMPEKGKPSGKRAAARPSFFCPTLSNLIAAVDILAFPPKIGYNISIKNYY
jgi:hypothetical protein